MSSLYYNGARERDMEREREREREREMDSRGGRDADVRPYSAGRRRIGTGWPAMDELRQSAKRRDPVFEQSQSNGYRRGSPGAEYSRDPNYGVSFKSPARDGSQRVDVKKSLAMLKAKLGLFANRK
eukprot:CAMPEP_0113904576 /NCGR_PEP_ID=MMETSP0780_2-20120614/23359_1 /TAXON_ID=652834 /ORGANISM="Palpitomonas bilix" /LENGTH=125 /DNA_ID=CAMNT_0000898261 /DNA_START=274 /DNA_END=651 /DNA_ORIENTATION=+ /assembly_acc=CAM_ASM_000599